MATTRSSTKDLDRLIADLHSPDSVRRDAAVARLRILGTRAVPRLTDVLRSDSPASVHALAMEALEGSDDVRVMDIALERLKDTRADVVIAALGVLRTWVPTETGTRVLDGISAIAVDRGRDARVRVAALAALSELPEHLLQPIRQQAPPPERAGPELDDPVIVREWIQAYGGTTPLTTLQDVVSRARERGDGESSARLRLEWLQTRGLAHQALARRESLLALYDLKETFEAATHPLPRSFVSAIEAIGDASCLEALARAWSGSTRDLTWQHQLSMSAAAIMKRARLTGRSALVKKLRANVPGFLK